MGLCAYANSLDIFYPNTTINGVDVAGLTAEQAAERLRQEGQLELMAALLSGDRRTFELFRCQAPELQHLPAATYEWYSKNYLDRDYPIRMLMKCRGIRFPEHIPGNESK